MSRPPGRPTGHRPIPTSASLVPRRAEWRVWKRCWEGTEPAEALPTRDREDLVWQMHELGWSDVQIAEHTRMSLYTTARIRNRLGLSASGAADTLAS